MLHYQHNILTFLFIIQSDSKVTQPVNRSLVICDKVMECDYAYNSWHQTNYTYLLSKFSDLLVYI
jgi:hypothetical protein